MDKYDILKEFGLEPEELGLDEADETSFGAGFDDGEAFLVDDHIKEYVRDGETNMLEDFEDLCDMVSD